MCADTVGTNGDFAQTELPAALWLGQAIDGQGQAPKLNVTLLPPLPATDQINTSPFPKNSS